jgi:hypothetical protein
MCVSKEGAMVINEQMSSMKNVELKLAKIFHLFVSRSAVSTSKYNFFKDREST